QASHEHGRMHRLSPPAQRFHELRDLSQVGEPMSDRPKETPDDDAAKATRRDVLGAIGLAGAGAIVGGGAAHVLHRGEAHSSVPATSLALHKPYVPGAEHYGTGEEHWVA